MNPTVKMVAAGLRLHAAGCRLQAGFFDAFKKHRAAWKARHRADRLARKADAVESGSLDGATR